MKAEMAQPLVFDGRNLYRSRAHGGAWFRVSFGGAGGGLGGELREPVSALVTAPIPPFFRPDSHPTLHHVSDASVSVALKPRTAPRTTAQEARCPD